MAPHLARTPAIFGDPEKVVIAKIERVTNALINVQSGNARINDYFLGITSIFLLEVMKKSRCRVKSNQHR